MKAKIPIIFFCLYAGITVQQALAIPETKVQALFLYKFIQNVNWPDGRKNLTVGVLGETDMQVELENMLNSRGNTSIVVRKITVAETLNCDIVFLPASQSSAFGAVVAKANEKSILIVTEESGLIKKGACISFMREGDNLSFVVNKSSLDKRKLQVTSSLLSLGKQV